MAARKEILISEFNTNIFELWDTTWLLLASGDFKNNDFNAMTVAWGSIGFMWNMPFVMVVVRPTRFTFGFINQNGTFSVNAFPEDYRDALNLLGTRSGRDGDKIADSGLTPVKLDMVTAPGFEEADLTIQCRKLYWEDFDPAKFIDPQIDKHYVKKDYHRMVFGEVLKITGSRQKYAK